MFAIVSAVIFAQTAFADYRFSPRPDTGTGAVNDNLFDSNVFGGSVDTDASYSAVAAGSADAITDSGGPADGGTSMSGQRYLGDPGNAGGDLTNPPVQAVNGTTRLFAVVSLGGASALTPDPVGIILAPEPATLGFIGLALCGIAIALRRKR